MNTECIKLKKKEENLEIVNLRLEVLKRCKLSNVKLILFYNKEGKKGKIKDKIKGEKKSKDKECFSGTV